MSSTRIPNPNEKKDLVPSELEYDKQSKTLWLRGRRNVAFGCRTINQMLVGIVDIMKKYEGEGTDCLYRLGLGAGDAFAEDFWKYLSTCPGKQGAPSPAEVLRVWEKYEDSSGFGFSKPRLVWSEEDRVYRGEIRIEHLFTADPPDLPSWRCHWMRGYLAGFLNKIVTLMIGEARTMDVSHPECAAAGTSHTDTCVFEVISEHRG